MLKLARFASGTLVIAPLLAATLGLGGCSLFKRDEEGGSGKGSPAPTAAAAPAPRVYEMTKRSEEDPDFTLTRVTVEPTGTKLDFTMKASTREFTIAVSPVGHDHAMFIETPDGKKYPFQRAVGITTNPERTTVPHRGSVSFTLVFAPIDPSVQTFSVFEGEDSKNPFERKKHELWVFRQVELKAQGFGR